MGNRENVMLLGPQGSEPTISRAEKKGQSSIPVPRKAMPSCSALLFAGLNCMGLRNNFAESSLGFLLTSMYPIWDATKASNPEPPTSTDRKEPVSPR